MCAYQGRSVEGSGHGLGSNATDGLNWPTSLIPVAERSVTAVSRSTLTRPASAPPPSGNTGSTDYGPVGEPTPPVPAHLRTCASPSKTSKHVLREKCFQFSGLARARVLCTLAFACSSPLRRACSSPAVPWTSRHVDPRQRLDAEGRGDDGKNTAAEARGRKAQPCAARVQHTRGAS